MAAQTPLHPDSGLALALAIVGSSAAPLVLLDGEFRLVAASESFFSAFAIPPEDAIGRPMFELGDGDWNVPQFRALLKATAAGSIQVDAYEMDLGRAPRSPRRLVINAHKLVYGEPDHDRLLLSIADITAARAASQLQDDLLRQKAILLQEVQHRVANSLQIIASVILQSARKVQSDETRAYLNDAHARVMSVANLQTHLSKSSLGRVELNGYLRQLCESIGASMIRDPTQLELQVECDASVIDADASISLGLMVTELVINALKHAFPGGRQGRIVVGYAAQGPGWRLSVRDDGVGIPTDGAAETAGLGTSIVAALARQLKARVEVGSAQPGTVITIVSDGAGAA